jgi:hypothetical protein
MKPRKEENEKVSMDTDIIGISLRGGHHIEV